MKFSLEQLATFEAVCRLGSFTAAAAEVFRAKSAVSHSVKALEESLGVRLLERDTRRLSLTPAGEQLLLRAREVLSAARAFEQAASDLSGGHEASLTLLVDGAAPMGRVMEAAQRLTREHLSTRLNVQVAHLNAVQERFERERVGLMVTFDFQPNASSAAISLSPIECVLVAHHAHPLARSAPLAPLTRHDLSGHVELVVAGCAQDPIGVHHEFRMGSPHLFEVSDFSLKRQALLRQVGYGWLPRHMIEPELAAGVLCALEVGGRPTRWLVPQLVYRLDPPLGVVGRRLVELLREALTQGGEAVEEGQILNRR